MVFNALASILGGGDKHFGYGMLEGVGEAGTKIYKDEDDRLEDCLL